MNAQLLTHPAYDFWRPLEATNLAGDGNADARVVPLVEHLRRKGVVTTHSCSGHDVPETPIGWRLNRPMDGYLAVLDDTVTPESIMEVRGDPFWGVEMHIWPEPLVIVFRWKWDRALDAIARLYDLEPRKG